MSPAKPLWSYVYLLVSTKDNKFYTGVTIDLDKRLKEHNDGTVYSTRHRRPLTLVYYEAYLNKEDAYRRERYLKSGTGKRYLRNRLRKGLTG